ncbi:hypothetical protein L3X38_005485 [Prunus dulcis]|uniref:F-box domain-containing protein n=1 Tax=Prunus dulcis TaxID=3755 RepID=A0AAD5F465_PRUDU|nr:hypothetical protein L3X38_005485 [Prunus dulcis]
MGMKHRQRKNNLGKKRKRKDQYNSVDRLVALPDDVLVSMLSPLSLREAATTSILSRRWRYVWAFTKSLDFDAKFFDDEVYQNFLQLQPALREQESLRYVNWVKLGVVGPSIALKYFAIKWCTLESIEIRDAKLVSFIYEGDATNLLLSNVPFLVEVTISEGIACNFLEESYFPCKSIELPFTQLSCCLSQLEIFMLDIDLAVIYNRDYVFPVLANVKHLELTVKANYDLNLFHLTSFMKASPLLQRLVLKLNCRTLRGRRQLKSAGEFPHHHLKLHWRKLSSIMSSVLMNLLKELVELKRSKKREQCLREKVPSTIEFVCP